MQLFERGEADGQSEDQRFDRPDDLQPGAGRPICIDGVRPHALEQRRGEGAYRDDFRASTFEDLPLVNWSDALDRACEALDPCRASDTPLPDVWG